MSSLAFPKIDFSGLDLSKSGTEAWVAARAKVMDALDAVGFFSAVFDDISGELLDELLGPMAKSLFSVPRDLRPSDKTYSRGYDAPGYASFLIDEDPLNLDSIRALANRLWPRGNPAFCETLWGYTMGASKLELMIRKMIMEGLGVAEHFDSLADSTKQALRIAEYAAPQDQQTMIGLPIHRDTNLITIIYQHRGEGLELLAKSGEWLKASPNTFSVVTGDSLRAWSNGRIKPTKHYVKMTNTGTRYSIMIGLEFKAGCTMEVPRELVNDENPKLFNAFNYANYMSFRFTEEGFKANDPLKAYCGVNGDDVLIGA